MRSLALGLAVEVISDLVCFPKCPENFDFKVEFDHGLTMMSILLPGNVDANGQNEDDPDSSIWETSILPCKGLIEETKGI